METQDNLNQEKIQKIQLRQINRALGIFLLFFSAVILVAVFFTGTFVGQMTNLAAGLILGLIGALLFLQPKRKQNTS
jgi:membrane associated rhomboid family serine protease